MFRRAVIIKLLAGLLLVAGVGFAWEVFHVEGQLARLFFPLPKIVYPNRVVLESVENGHSASVEISIGNEGSADLAISDVQNSCSCSGLEHMNKDGAFEPLRGIRIGPGEAKEFRIRVAYNGEPGQTATSLIRFKTNDPQQPIANIQVAVLRITGGIATDPASINFGLLRRGQKANLFVDLFDGGNLAREIGEVVSNSPGRVKATLIPVVIDDIDPSKSGRRRIGRLAVTANTDEIGSLNSAVLIKLLNESRAPDVIPVSGRVADVVEVIPAAVFLPRKSISGDVYSATILVTSQDERGFRLETKACPQSMRVSIHEGNEIRHIHRVLVELTDKRAASPIVVEFTARLHDDSSTFAVPIHIGAE